MKKCLRFLWKIESSNYPLDSVTFASKFGDNFWNWVDIWSFGIFLFWTQYIICFKVWEFHSAKMISVFGLSAALTIFVCTRLINFRNDDLLISIQTNVYFFHSQIQVFPHFFSRKPISMSVNAFRLSLVVTWNFHFDFYCFEICGRHRNTVCTIETI